ncbi:ATP-binding cassette domain-containing protein [uncultured Maricaulis sp.]|uniref:type I secretion system permease/ATPase n=1 Tax=uncultured Maricaulis sp. TaxID=174710 RepID=UPI0030D6DFF6|tara:strand:- start:14734 stop:16428 length:1695 start_codon:yes stop_codon:yes gene_type:complete
MTQPLSLQVRTRLKPYAAALAGFSLASNLLLLVSPFYMLQVYDRILSSGSTDTLIWLTALAVMLLSVYGASEAARRRICALAGVEIENFLVPKIFAKFEAGTGGKPALSQDLALAGRVQGVFQAGSVLPFADLPFAPIFLIALFLVHPFLGVLGLVGAAIVFGVAVMAELTTRDASKYSQTAMNGATEMAAGLERQHSAMVAMGLVRPAFSKWQAAKLAGQTFALEASKADGKFTAISRSARQVLQIFVLGGGAALALTHDISPGSIVASSILLARALGPIDQIVGGWRSSILAWRAWAQLQARLEDIDEQAVFTPLPRPAANLVLERLSVVVPGAREPLIHPFSFSAKGGQLIALAGGNGAGKTTLLQTLSGAWLPGSGAARLGGCNLHEWRSADRGRYVGYVPQDVELLPATIAENIGRLGATTPEAVFHAAKTAGAHEMIVTLPDGYDTRIGPGGAHLSAGQRQMIGLARALFGNPVLLLLDEPTANLDAAAAPQLIKALVEAAERGAVVIVSSHDRRLIERATTVMLVRNGSILAATAEQYLKLATGPGAANAGGQGAVG